jgi:hypothetical protein
LSGAHLYAMRRDVDVDLVTTHLALRPKAPAGLMQLTDFRRSHIHVQLMAQGRRRSANHTHRVGLLGEGSLATGTALHARLPDFGLTPARVEV